VNYGRLPLDEQLDAFQDVLLRNRTLAKVLTRAAVLALPEWYLVAGCLYQTVWNFVTGRSAEAGILDYDLAYFDASDLSWEGEDAVIQAGRTLFGDLPAPVQIRNQARVHLWYEQKFRAPCAPHASTEAAIDTFEATNACLGVRLEPGERWRVYAPHGLGDVFNLVVRPNPVLAPPSRLPGQDHPVAAGMAFAQRAALARPARLWRKALTMARRGTALLWSSP
jgi:uncharacterized protein